MAGPRNQDQDLRNRTVMVWLGAFIALALLLRIAFGFGAFYDEESERYLYSGNDPWYHDRTVDHILETGESLSFDPAIAFPAGAANPNPPIFDWTTAPVAGLFEAMGVPETEAVGLALNVMVGVWGALTVIPVYLLAATVWNRKAGLWAGFLMAVSAPHIQRTAFGFADHDATTLFWISTAMYLFVKALKTLDHRDYVRAWGDGAARMEGIKASFTHNKQAYLYACMAGTALAATALTWKGYPYVLAIMSIALFLQLIRDHVKNLDSTAVFGIYMLPMFLVTLLPLPFYMQSPSFMDTTIIPGMYVLAGMLVAGLILVPTRDMPSIVVFPGLAAAAAVGGFALWMFFNDIFVTITTGLGYFEQTKLYGTIAEAQRTELGFLAANFGFFTFLLVIWITLRSLRAGFKGDVAQMLLASWAIVAAFMAFAASRFISNAAPIFAVLAGAGIAILLDRVPWSDLRRRFRQQHGKSNVAMQGMRSLDGKTLLVVGLVAAFVVMPNLWLGVDAGTPREVDADHGRFLDVPRLGAFGQSPGIETGGWLESFDHLATLDTHLDLEDRPAFIAWWDYGHWAVAVGEHPTVADPFQHNFNLAGRFLASESEQEGVMWLTILLINHDYHDDDAPGYAPGTAAALDAISPNLREIGPMRGYDDEAAVYQEAIDWTVDDGGFNSTRVFALYDAVREATGDSIEYFGVDSRMFPLNAGNPGIFYAPVYLANKDPDDFAGYTYTGQAPSGQTLTFSFERYGVDDNGNSFEYTTPRLINQADPADIWRLLPGGQQAQPWEDPVSVAGDHSGNPNVIDVQGRFAPTPLFQSTMYARAFGHIIVGGAAPGDGLTHWRAIQSTTSALPDGAGEQRLVTMLHYYTGVTVSGRVVDDLGAPIEGAEVSFVDGFGASHDVGTTDADGGFSIIAPFSQDDDLNLTVRIGGTPVAGDTSLQFSLEQARSGDAVDGVSLEVERGSLEGVVFRDLNGDGMYNASVDDALPDAEVTVAGMTVTTDSQGRYDVTGLQPGSLSVSASLEGYTPASRTVNVPAGATATQDLALTQMPAQVNVTLMQDGQPFTDAVVPIEFVNLDTDDTRETSTAPDSAVATTSLPPGSYEARVAYEYEVDGVAHTLNGSSQFEVPFGAAETVMVQIDL